jgi:hypothetical protein
MEVFALLEASADTRSHRPSSGQVASSRTRRFYAYMVDNQAIVIPETIDAIRALTGTVRDGRESIARTDSALGIGSVFQFTRAVQ